MSNPALYAFALTDDLNGLRDRSLLLIGFVCIMFILAGLAHLVGKRAGKKRNAREINSLTGVIKGAERGDDRQVSTEDWWREAVAHTESERVTAPWAQTVLGPDADELGKALPGLPVRPPGTTASEPSVNPQKGAQLPSLPLGVGALPTLPTLPTLAPRSPALSSEKSPRLLPPNLVDDDFS